MMGILPRLPLRIGTVALIVFAAALGMGLISVDWGARYLWFAALGHAQTFWTMRVAGNALFAGAAIPVFFYLWLNARLLAARTDLFHQLLHPKGTFTQALVDRLPLLLSLIGAVVVGKAFFDGWDLGLRFAYGPDTGRSDPVFGRDLGFHLFTVPFIAFVARWLLGLTIAVTAAIALGYAYARLLPEASDTDPEHSARSSRAARLHLGINVALLLASLALVFWLDRFQLLTSPEGAVYGAGATEVHVTRVALWVAVALSMLAIPTFLFLAYRRSVRELALGLGGYAIAIVLLTQMVPYTYRAYVVEPSELEIEKPYIERNIAATRRAFNLDQIKARRYETGSELTRSGIQTHRATLGHVPLWNRQPMQQTFSQLQRIRSYYTFRDVDAGRYHLDGEYRQVLLSARELATELPGRSESWVNTHLQYTHGIGLAMADASRKLPGGSPELLVRDLPPKSPPALPIKRPEIYYGEGMTRFRLVNTGVREFDYPSGQGNVYTSYAGDGGVRLDAGWKRVLYAIDLRNPSLFLTDYLENDSRIQLARAIEQRVGRLAPFLRLDSDPYLVVADGRLQWMIDAYTTSRNYPYAEPIANGANYMRNSVKVTVDAYDGEVTLYVFDQADPVLQAYRHAFPALFQPASAMPDALRRHIRYPRDLFEAQVSLYATYHMTDPQVFYNREDVWSVPQEKYGGSPVAMRPYYVLMQLPQSQRLEYVLIQPLTPANRDNMIAWMAGRSDAPAYGQLRAYRLPKESLVVGPMQIEAKIDQDTLISRQLSLWDQRGSSVIRGNLLVIPVAGSFLYVEPVYLLAEGAQLPQLKRVIVSDGDRLAMEPTLSGALRVVFGARSRETAGARAPAEGATEFPDREQAREALQRARQALEAGKWGEFGEAMKQLEDTLQQTADESGE